MGQPNCLYSEGGLMSVWEISEGGAKCFYAMKLVSPKDLGFRVLETLDASSL